MLSDIAQAGAKALGGARFSLVNVLPATLLAALVLAVARSGAYGSGKARLAAIVPRADELSAGSAVILIFVLFVVGILLQPFQIALVQLLEGYWGESRPGWAAARLAIECHRRRYVTATVLSEAEAESRHDQDVMQRTFAQVARRTQGESRAGRISSRADRLLKRYPADPEFLMPTMLGNVLRNGEIYAGGRYGLDALTVYPRMYPSLSKPLSEAMSRQLDVIGTTASFCVSFGVATLATAPLLRRLDLWSLIPAAVLLLSIVSYRGAVRAAEMHATLFATTFDLHRFDMLRAMHYPLPKNVEQEQKFNWALTNFLQSRTEPHSELAVYGYEHLSPKPVAQELQESQESQPELSPEPMQTESAQKPNPLDPAR